MSIRQACSNRIKKSAELTKKGSVASLNAMGLAPIADIQHFYKLATFWIFLFIMAVPDLYNLAIQFHLIDVEKAPEALTHLVNLVGFMGAAIRLVRSRKAAQMND